MYSISKLETTSEIRRTIHNYKNDDSIRRFFNTSNTNQFSLALNYSNDKVKSLEYLLNELKFILDEKYFNNNLRGYGRDLVNDHPFFIKSDYEVESFWEISEDYNIGIVFTTNPKKLFKEYMNVCKSDPSVHLPEMIYTFETNYKHKCIGKAFVHDLYTNTIIYGPK